MFYLKACSLPTNTVSHKIEISSFGGGVPSGETKLNKIKFYKVK